MNAIDAEPDPDDPSGSSAPHAHLIMAGEIIAIIVAVIIYGYLHLQARRYRVFRPESPYFIFNFFRSSSECFIFRRCCGKRIKHAGPLEQDYQPYEMMRPQGQHDAEARGNKGSGDVGVSGV